MQSSLTNLVLPFNALLVLGSVFPLDLLVSLDAFDEFTLDECSLLDSAVMRIRLTAAGTICLRTCCALAWSPPRRSRFLMRVLSAEDSARVSSIRSPNWDVVLLVADSSMLFNERVWSSEILRTLALNLLISSCMLDICCI